MTIFFPLFTILEDLGYLPRVAFNLDRIFESVGAHGKQALTLSMGFGCNAAGVIAARVIDSPRERLIAIITEKCRGTVRQPELAPVTVKGPVSETVKRFKRRMALRFFTLD